MNVGYHIIFGTYGFWLPNDPRGSWSEVVKSWELARSGEATKVTEIGSVAYRQHDHQQRLAAKDLLKYPPVQLTGAQARAVGRGFADYVRRVNILVWACAILPDHVHIVTGPLRIGPKQTAIQLKGAATRFLLAEDLHPLQAFSKSNGRPPNCFAKGEWKVILEADDVPHVVQYVELNPEKEGKPQQHWSFVTSHE